MKRIVWLFIWNMVGICLNLPISRADVTKCQQTTQPVQRTKIYFGNGIRTPTEDDAIKDRKRIENELITRVPQVVYSSLDFDLAYNQSGGVWLDLLEAAKQKAVDDTWTSGFVRWMSDLSQAPIWFQDTAKTEITDETSSLFAFTPDLPTHFGNYAQDLVGGENVIVVAHSQGNLHVNEVYNALFGATSPLRNASSSFRIVSVATPASYIPGESSDTHTTIIGDAIISAISGIVAEGALGVLPPLLPNVLNTVPVADSLWEHSFRDAYMYDGTETKERILNQLVNLIGNPVPPPKLIGDGIITATLTWGTFSTFNLDVTEPNGVQTSTAFSYGQTSGVFDLNTRYYGPDHYTVACSTLETGTYRIGATYFNSNTSAPQTALIQVKAGALTQTFERTFQALDRPSVPFADVVVSGNATDGFTFAIHDASSQ